MSVLQAVPAVGSGANERHIMSNSSLPRVAGPFCVTDIHGVRLCCPAASSKRDNGTVRSAMRAAWLEALTLAGAAEVRDGVVWVLCVDMVWRPRHDSDASISRERDGLTDFGHVVADSLGGVYCGGNALPIEGATNRNDGDARPTVSPAWPMDAYADAWRTVASERMTKTKRARLV